MDEVIHSPSGALTCGCSGAYFNQERLFLPEFLTAPVDTRVV